MILDDARLLDARQWLYVGEGAANIVVCYVGPIPEYVRERMSGGRH